MYRLESFDKPVLPIIYDLSHVRFPQAHPKERVEWLEKQLKLLADVPFVQTISEFSKSEIVAFSAYQQIEFMSPTQRQASISGRSGKPTMPA